MDEADSVGSVVPSLFERWYLMFLTKKVLAFGEIIWDVYPDQRYIGGAPLNFAAHCAGCGLQASLISAVGSDELGSEALARVREMGVREELIGEVKGKPTGQCLVTLKHRRIPTYNVLTDVAFDHIALSEEQLSLIRSRGFDALYFGTLIQRSPVSRSSLCTLLESCSFSNIFCDLNLRPDCYDSESISLCLRNASILKLSDEEEPTLRELGFYQCFSDEPEAIAKAIAARYGNLKMILITCGERGSYAYDTKNQIGLRQPAAPTPVVSTVGAGDSFSAAWLSAYLEGLPLSICMRQAAELSAFVVSRKDAVPQK